MVFKTIGDKSNPVILFFHAMGVTGESSMPVAEKWQINLIALCRRQQCIVPGRNIAVKKTKYSKLYNS